jgi:membrane-associated phospholipid phosphatase
MARADDDGRLSYFARFVAVLPLTAGAYGSYLYLGTPRRPIAPPVTTPLDAAIPFVAETVWLYLPGYVAGFLVALYALKATRELVAAMLAYLAVTLAAVPFFYLWPIAGPRPPAPLDPTWSAAFVRTLYANDPNFCTLPSLHVACATLTAAIVYDVDRRWGRLTWLLAMGVWVSVLTLKQHWLADVVGGWSLAAGGIWVWRAARASDLSIARGTDPSVRSWFRRGPEPERRRSAPPEHAG